MNSDVEDREAIAAATEDAVLARHTLREWIRDAGAASEEDLATAVAAEESISSAIDLFRAASSGEESGRVAPLRGCADS